MFRTSYSLAVLAITIAPTLAFAQSQISSGGSTTGAPVTASPNTGTAAPQATSGLANQPSTLSPYAAPSVPSNDTQSPWLNYNANTNTKPMQGDSVSGSSSSSTTSASDSMSSQATGQQPITNGTSGDAGRAPTQAPYTGTAPQPATH